MGSVCALVIGMYVWSAKPGCLELWSSNAANNYYNLLVRGFGAGQLNLKREVPSSLAQLPNSGDPAVKSLAWSARMQLLDLSYYRGKLYFYFGVTPALVLLWPYAALSGHHLPHNEAVVIFFSVGFLASVGLLWSVWRRYFVEISVWVVAAGALALGLANFSLACLLRGGVYEVAISCGYGMMMVTLMLVWQAIHVRRERAWWLAGASLAYGLALGARPSLLFGAVILLVPMAMSWRARAGMVGRSQLWTSLLAATVPITVIGLVLLLHNFLRFDNPFEFGHQYALSWAGQHPVQSQLGVHPFSLRFLWCNFLVYFLAPAQWSVHFPFAHDIASPLMPVGHVGIEHVFGVLPNTPLVWLAFTTPLTWHCRLGKPHCALRWFGMTLVLLLGVCALTLSLFFAACIRYEVEFLPALVLLAVLGILGLERTRAGRPVWRRTARWGWGLLLAASVSFNLLAMIALSSDLCVALGVFAVQDGKLSEAVVQYQKALKLQPDSWRAHVSLGTALLQQDKAPEAIPHLEAAVRLNPGLAGGHDNLGMALCQMGRFSEAIKHLEEALRLKPDFPEAHRNLGFALLQQGRSPEAQMHLEEALRLKCEDAKTAHNNLGMALLQQGKAQEAISHFEQALRLDPDFAEAHNNLGMALFRVGRLPEAIGYLTKVVRLKPDDARTHNNLAWVLATCADESVRNGVRAVEHAEQASLLSGGKDPGMLDTLAAAYAAAGRYDDALRTARAALELVTRSGQAEWAQRIGERLQLYQSGRPYHAGSAPER